MSPRSRAGAAALGVAVLVAVAVVAVIVAYPTMVREVGSEASTSGSLSFSDREIAGGNGIVVDQSVVYAARALIPEDENYHVAVAPDYAAGGDLTRDHVASYYRYFLMPRRPVQGAPWIICYGCDVAEYGAGAEVLWEGDENISIVRVGT
jgi:hypothetical protein